MQHEQELKNILYQYNYDFSNISWSADIHAIINQIEHDLIFKSLSLEVSEKIMCDLWKFEQSINRGVLKNGLLKNMIEQLTSNRYYTVENNYIVCKKFIQCEAIRKSSLFYILDQNQINLLTQYGYGVQSYKVLIDSEIRDISCYGKHPNLSSSGTFCWDNNLRNISFTIDNFSLVERMLSQFNLDSCYITIDERKLLTSIIQSGEKPSSYNF
jgi:hypothetical protein